MARIIHHPDGYVRIEAESGTYTDTLANFALDHGAEIEALPDDIIGRLYEPERLHALFTGGDQRGGPLPWEAGDGYLAAVADLLTAQTARRAADIPEPAPLTLEAAKDARKADVDARLQQIGADGLEFGGKRLQLREADQQNVIAMVQAAMMVKSGLIPWPADFKWRMRDNSYLDLPSADAMVQLAAFAMQQVKRLRFVGFAHKDAIDALTTVADVLAYDVTAGW